jgi:sugar phosphate isomerase/epimerase
VRIALCNEVIAPMSFPAQCEYAAKLGYDGLEIAPYTLSEEPHRMGAARVAAARAAAEDAGIAVTGLHWLPGCRSAPGTKRPGRKPSTSCSH